MSPFLFHWRLLSWKWKSLKAELYLLSHVSAPQLLCTLTHLQAHTSPATRFPSAPASPTKTLILTRNYGSHAKISRHGHSSAGTKESVTLIIKCTLLFLWRHWVSVCRASASSALPCHIVQGLKNSCWLDSLRIRYMTAKDTRKRMLCRKMRGKRIIPWNFFYYYFLLRKVRAPDLVSTRASQI